MKVQKIQLCANHHSYIVIDNDYLPVKPILRFIRYLDNCDKSINTVRAYAIRSGVYGSVEKINKHMRSLISKLDLDFAWAALQ